MKQNIKILYVEDEERIRENTKRPLSYLCDELIIAQDGKEGLRLYEAEKPDIVISDIKMPSMNGIDMVKAIKQIEKNQHIIFTTAHSESGFFIEAIELQVDGYILKPIDYDLLEEKIESIKEQINVKEKLKAQEVITQEITELQESLLVILDDNRNIIFLNNKFAKFFQVIDNLDFIKKYKSLDSVLVKDQSFTLEKDDTKLDWISHVEAIEKTERIISISDVKKSLEKSFLVSIKRVKETAHILLTFTEITSIATQKDEFEHKAFTDELTGIYNRAYFNDKLHDEISRAKRDNVPFSFMILDIDFFKKFNDKYGHQFGDEILKELSQLITKHTRDTDTFARWGGEEFIKLLPHTSIEYAQKVAEKIRKKIDNHSFKDGSKVTCSFGVTQFKADDTEETLIKRADDALYKAKNSGRNQVQILVD